MTENILHVSGQVDITLYDANGMIKDHRNIPNMVVAGGRKLIASLLVGDGLFNKPSKMAVGSGTTSPDLTDIALGSELARVDLDNNFGERTDNSVTYVATFNPGVGTGAITECGIFNTSVSEGGEVTMLNRTTFAVVNKAAADTLTINWTVTIN